jgi:hypothetical protein
MSSFTSLKASDPRRSLSDSNGWITDSRDSNASISIPTNAETDNAILIMIEGHPDLVAFTVAPSSASESGSTDPQFQVFCEINRLVFFDQVHSSGSVKQIFGMVVGFALLSAWCGEQ